MGKKAGASDVINESVVVNIETPTPVLTGLTAYIKKLNELEATISRINTKLSGISTNTNLRRGPGYFSSQITKRGAQSTEALANLFGYKPEDVAAFGSKIEKERKAALRKIEDRIKETPRLTATMRVSRARQRLDQQRDDLISKEFFTTARADTLQSAAKAEQFFQAYQAQALRKKFGRSRISLGNILEREMSNPAVSDVHGGPPGAAKVEGTISLLIPGNMVQASLTSPITLSIRGDQVNATTGVKDPKTGEYLPGDRTTTGSRGGRDNLKTGGSSRAPVKPGELSRVAVETDKTFQETVTVAESLGKKVAKTYNDIGNVLKTQTTKTGEAATQIESLNNQRKEIENAFKIKKAGGKGDYLGLAKIQTDIAKDLEGILTPANTEMLGGKTAPLVNRIQSQMKLLRAQALANTKAAKAEDQQKRAAAEAEDRQKREANLANIENEVRRTAAHNQNYINPKVTKVNDARLRAEDDARLRAEDDALAEAVAKRNQKLVQDVYLGKKVALQNAPVGLERLKGGGPNRVHKKDIERFLSEGGLLEVAPIPRASVAPVAPVAPVRRSVPPRLDINRQAQLAMQDVELNKSLAAMRTRNADEAELKRRAKVRSELEANQPPGPGNKNGYRTASPFSPIGFLTNLGKVAGWAAAVGVLYKSLELVSYSMGRIVEVGQQTNRLQQVFRGVGGSAQELARDVMTLAAANGRSTDEAMAAAIQWSRLGLNRAQVNEAVRVSLVAANVAEISAADATEYLSSLMQVYGLRVDQLSGALGQLNQTSNTFNVTNADLFEGIARSASIAQQAGISFAELQGTIGAAVGATGQSGANIGNAFKSILVSLSKPEIQSFLRDGFNLEVTGANPGEMKQMSQVMGELSVAWQSMNKEERNALVVRVAGKTQASRMVAILNSFEQAQTLAADGQLNLNSAEQENLLILGSLKSALAGLTAEWDRFVVVSGKPVMKGLTEAVRLGGNLLGAATGGNRPEPKFTAEENKYYQERHDLGWFGGFARPKPFPKNAQGIDRFQEWRGENLGFFKSVNSMFDSPETKAKLRAEAASRDVSAELNVLTERISAFEKKKMQMQRLQKELGDPRDTALLGRVLGFTIGDSAEQLVKEGKFAEAKAVAAEQEAIYTGKEADERKAWLDKQKGRLQTLDDAKAVQEKIIATSPKDSPAYTKAVKEERRIEMERLVKEQDKPGDQVPMDSGDDLKRMVLMAQTKIQLEQIADLYNQFAPDSLTERLQVQLGLLEQEEAILRNAAKGNVSEAKKIEYETQADQKRADRIAMDSPVNHGILQTRERRQLAGDRENQRIDAMGVGDTEAEKMLTRQKQLTEDIRKLQMIPVDNSSENQKVDLLMDQKALYHGQEEIAKRLIMLEGQRKQIILDSNHDSQKSLLFSGPGELLRKLAVNQQFKSGRINVGSWGAMSEAGKRDADELMGGDAGATNRRELSFLRPYARTVEQQQGDRNWGIARVNEAQRALQTQNTPGMDELKARAAAAAELNSLARSAIGLNLVFNGLGSTVQMAVDVINEAVKNLPTSTGNVSNNYSNNYSNFPAGAGVAPGLKKPLTMDDF